VVLEFVVGMVLLIACANLANLLLAVAASREREISVRQAIGAGRGRLVRQLLTESLLVSAIGASLAIVVAGWLSRAILRFLPPDAAGAVANLTFRFDPRVLGFTGALTLITCLLFGLAPALRATRTSLTPALKESTGGAGQGRWTSRGLVIGEVALCAILLIGAGLFVQSLWRIRSLDSGFVAEHVLVAGVKGPREYRRAELQSRIDALREQIAVLPGVRASGASQVRPLSGFAISGMVEAEGHIPAPGEDADAYDLSISPGFYVAMGTPLIEGRDFTGRDDANAPRVAIVNESFARQFFPGRSPMGRRFGIDGPASVGAMEIVGLVRDTRWIGLRRMPTPMYYRPYRQSGAATTTLAFRTTGDLGALAAALERASHNLDPRLSLKDVVPFTEMEDRSLVVERLVAQVSACFGILALLVACVGLYGMLAYGVARRTREIGVRIALGASLGGVQWMVLRESLLLLVAGFALGVPAALALARLVASLLFGLTPADPVNIAASLLVMIAVSLCAAFIPARRAARVDPMVALRYE
jgi:predicted permease